MVGLVMHASRTVMRKSSIVPALPRSVRHVGPCLWRHISLSHIDIRMKHVQIFVMYHFISLLPLFCKKKRGLWDNHTFSVSVCLYNPPINFWIPETIFKKLGMYIIASEPISTAYFINPSNHSLSVCEFSTIARQRVGKNVTATTNKQATKEKLLDAPFSIRSVSSERKLVTSSS
jgi:hypothetical protein